MVSSRIVLCDDKTVAVKYDADKTTVESLIKGFAKIKYSAVPVTEKKEGEKSTCPEKTTCPEETEECCTPSK